MKSIKLANPEIAIKKVMMIDRGETPDYDGHEENNIIFSKCPNLDDYDENTEEHECDEYYRICPEEVYEFNSYGDDIEFESTEKLFDEYCGELQSNQFKSPLELVSVLKASIDRFDDVDEVLLDFKESSFEKMEVKVSGDWYLKLIDSLLTDYPTFVFTRSKIDNGGFLFLISF